MNPRLLTRRVSAVVAPALAVALSGCQNPRGTLSVASADPELKIPAIEQDVRLHDERDDPQMARDLNDPDPAVRFYAVQGLRRLTGDDFGYRYYEDEAARAPAVSRWRAWVSTHPGGSAVAQGAR